MCIFPPATSVLPRQTSCTTEWRPFQRVRDYLTAKENGAAFESTALDETSAAGGVWAALFLPSETEYGYMFVTWDGTTKDRVLIGAYHLDGYAKAKQDFAIRSG
jgi:hypothetical protein